jgi:lysophospholipase L1-like esterase
MATNKTPLHVVVQKIQSGRITEPELSRYFSVAPNPRQPFDFIVTINADTVDLENVESAAFLGEPLLSDAGRVVAARARAPRKPAKYKRKLPIIAEGDSWFKLPDLIFVPPTLIDILQRKYSIINLAHWGDTLSDIILAGEFWGYLKTADTFLFSAGGNDMLGGGQLWRFLNLFDVDHAKPADAPYYLKQEFYDNLDIVIKQYESVITQIESRYPHVIMLGHGYDYVIPRPDGPWLGGPMARQGLDPTWYAKLCQAIARVMVDAFNSRLHALARAHAKNFRYVDLRGSVRPGDWWDELHPKESGATKTAAKFAAALESLPAVATVPVHAARSRPRLRRAA